MDEWDSPFQSLWKKLAEERHQKIETACEMSLLDERRRGVLVVENQYGEVLSADLSEVVPYGQMYFIRRQTIRDNRTVSPPAEGS